MTDAYPLQWPHGRPRNPYPERSRFGDRSVDRATKALLDEIRMLGGSMVVISTNIKLRKDGFPHSGLTPPTDKGVAVYFTHKRQSMCFACDRWDRIQDNIYAIAMTIGALRGIERWGSGSMVEQAFTGFVALPAPEDPHTILGVRPGATADEIDSAFRQRSKSAHPDAEGGSVEAMQKLNDARNTLKRRAG